MFRDDLTAYLQSSSLALHLESFSISPVSVHHNNSTAEEDRAGVVLKDGSDFSCHTPQETGI